MDVTDLTTERLVIKPHTLANADRLHAWQNDLELLHSNSDDAEPRSKQRVDDSLERWIRSTSMEILHRAIHLRASGEFIGFCQLAFIDPVHKRCKLGITIGEKRYWGMGYGTEVIHALVQFAFSHLQLRRVAAEVFSINQRAIRLFKGVGFQQEGILRENIFKPDLGFIDEYLYGLLASEYSTPSDATRPSD